MAARPSLPQPKRRTQKPPDAADPSATRVRRAPRVRRVPEVERCPHAPRRAIAPARVAQTQTGGRTGLKEWEWSWMLFCIVGSPEIPF